MIKVSQAVSSEIVLEKLIDMLMRTAIEHAGAERGLLILPRGEDLRIEAEATTDGDTVTVRLPGASVAGARLPESIVHYVVRTQESVILADASARNPFSADTYIGQHHARSVLCLPWLKQGKLIGVLYLENNLTSHVFTPARIAVLKLLASEAAISLENTRLYGDLQEREAKVRRVVDNGLDAVLGMDEQGRITEWNPQAETMFGWRREEAVGQRLSEMLIPMRYRSDHEEGLRRFLTSGEGPLLNRRVEITAVRRDGSEFPVEVSIAPYRIGGTWAFSGFVRDITERKRAEEALRESERRYALAMRASGVGHWDWKIASDEFYASARLLEICGFPPDMKFSRRAEVVDRIAFHPDDRAQYEAAVAAHFAGETPRVDIVIRIVPHGEIRWLHVIGMCSRDADGKPVRWAGSLSDITERKRADEALRASEARFRSLTELSSDWYWEQDENLRFTYMSDQAAAFGGFSPESSIGKLRWERPGITPLSCSWAEHQAVLAARQPFRDLELSRRMPDGSLGYYTISGAPIFDGGRRFRGYQGIGRSITERKRIEEALKLSEERYARAMEATAEGHWDWNTVTDELFVSPRMKQLFGFAPERQFASRAEFIALQPFHPGDRERLNATVQAAIAGAGSLYEVDYRIHPRAGEMRWLRSRGKVFRDAQGNSVRVSGSVTDITERKRAEAERLKLEERLRQAEKMEAIGRLAGGIAHDFNNVLGGIFAYGEMLYEEAPENSSRKRHARNLLTAATRGRALVEQILAYSRSQGGKREPTDIGRMVAETLELVRGFTAAQYHGQVARCRVITRRHEQRHATAPGHHEPVQQCDPRAGQGRHVARRARGQRRERRARAIARKAHARPVRLPDRRGQRMRNGRGDPRPHLRTVLYHQGSRSRYGPGPVARVRDRHRPGRRDRREERACAGKHVRDLPAVGRDPGRCCSIGCSGRTIQKEITKYTNRITPVTCRGRSAYSWQTDTGKLVVCGTISLPLLTPRTAMPDQVIAWDRALRSVRTANRCPRLIAWRQWKLSFGCWMPGRSPVRQSN